MHDDSLKLKSHLIVEIIVNPIHKNELILTALEEKIERMIKQREAKQNQGIWCAPPPSPKLRAVTPTLSNCLGGYPFFPVLNATAYKNAPISLLSIIIQLTVRDISVKTKQKY